MSTGTAISNAQRMDLLIESEIGGLPEVRDGLIRNIDKIKSLMPATMRDDAERCVRKALLYYSEKKELDECTVASKVKAVFDAAEMGLMLDGRLCHAVSFNCKKKDSQGRERWVKEVKAIPDYRGLIVVARRTTQIVDITADVVRAGDHFVHGRNGANSTLEHVRSGDGEVTWAYAILTLPGGHWRYELMSRKELDAIKARTKSKDKQGNVFGQWADHETEMQRKTVAKRALKTYCDDPGLARALELDDSDYETGNSNWIPADSKKVTSVPLAQALNPPKPQNTLPPPSDDPPQEGDPNLAEFDDEEPETIDTTVTDPPAGKVSGQAPSQETAPENPPAGDAGDPNALEGLTDELAECEKISDLMRVAQGYPDEKLTNAQRKAKADAVAARKQAINAAKQKKSGKLIDDSTYPT